MDIWKFDVAPVCKNLWLQQEYIYNWKAKYHCKQIAFPGRYTVSFLLREVLAISRMI